LGTFYVGGDTAPILPIAGAIQGQWVVPNIIQTSGAIYVGYAGTGGQFGVARIPSSLAVSTTTLATREVDDHNVPAVIQTNSGKMLAVYNRHSLVTSVYNRLSASSDATDWGSERTATASTTATYLHLHRLTGVDRIWILYRVGNSSVGDWVIRYSDDEGATFSTERLLAPNTYLTSVPDPDGVNIRCFAYDHPVNGTDHDIYYFRVNLSTGDVTNSVGTVLGNVVDDTGLPITKGEEHKAVDVTDPVNTRMYELAKVGVPAMVGSEFTEELSGTYYRYTYATSTTPFTRSAIATSGPAFITATYYYGGACFDESSQDIVYVARNLSAALGVGSWELVKMQLLNGVWERAEIIRTSRNIIARPQVKYGRLWWSEISRYVDYTDFTAAVFSRAI